MIPKWYLCYDCHEEGKVAGHCNGACEIVYDVDTYCLNCKIEKNMSTKITEGFAIY